MHVLEVVEITDDPEGDWKDWSVEHDETCPVVEEDTPEGIVAFEHHNCTVGNEIAWWGLDSLDQNLNDLEPGRYEIEFWSEHHSGGWWGDEEWDAGLRIVRKLDESLT